MFNSIDRSLKMIGMTLRNHAPQIYEFVGTGLVIGGTVLACKATLDCQPIIEDHKTKLADIHEKQAKDQEDGVDIDRRKEIAEVYLNTGVQIAKKAAVPVTVELAGIACMHRGFGEMSDKYIGATVLAEAASIKLNNYRARVLEDVGPDKDIEYYYGLNTKNVTKTIVDPETGEVTKEKGKIYEGSIEPGTWGFFFDESSELYTDSPLYNKMQIKSVLDELYRDLKKYNCVTMNDIVKKFGFNKDMRDRLLTQTGHDWGFMHFRNGENPYGPNCIACNMFKADGSIDPRNARFEERTESVAYIEFYPYYIADKKPYMTRREIKEVEFVK